MAFAVLLILLIPISDRFVIAHELYEANLHANPQLDKFPAPRHGERILVFAPHEDDETLGCGGYIQQATAVGAHVTIVFMTNGDYPRHSLSLCRPALRLTPASYIELGYTRQQESLRADQSLGVPASSIIFLGYPNGPLYRMWLPEHWLSENPASSVRTLCGRSPYTNSFTPGAIYCGESLLSDVEKIIKRVQPDIIFTLHPNDTNADHWSTYAFTRFALGELMEQGEPFTRTCRVYSYIVHRQHWPAPMRYRPDMPLYPPVQLTNINQTHWRVFPLTHVQVSKKYSALGMYQSQGGHISPLLRAMARKNELFGFVPVQTWLTMTSMPLRTVTSDPSAEFDSELLTPHADIVSLQLGHVNGKLIARFNLSADPILQDSYHLSIHAGGVLPIDRMILRYDRRGKRLSGCMMAHGELSKISTAELSSSTSAKAVTFTAPWPFGERQRFFMVRAWTTPRDSQRTLDETATTTVHVGDWWRE